MNIEGDGDVSTDDSVASGVTASCPDNSNPNFWNQMDTLLETKLTKFEEKLNTNIKEEIQKAVEPMKNELEKLTSENRKLNAELSVIKSKQKEEKERNDKVVKILKEDHITMARTD